MSSIYFDLISREYQVFISSLGLNFFNKSLVEFNKKIEENVNTSGKNC